MTVVRLTSIILNGSACEINQKLQKGVVLSRITTWTLAFAFILLLASCGSQIPNGGSSSGTNTYESVPANIGQALAVVAAEKELGITPQAAKDMWVVSTLIHDPQMRPAFWANLIVKGQQPGNFWGAVTTAKPGDLVYLTGAAKNRTFNSDVFPVELLQKFDQNCSACRLVVYSHSLLGVKGNTWYGSDGKALLANDVAKIKESFARVSKSVEDGDIPAEMAKRWDRLIKESPDDPNPVAPTLVQAEASVPIMNIGSQFYKPEAIKTKGISPQITTRNECTRTFFWSCTVRIIEGELRTAADYDWGNDQYINSDLGWNRNPKQDYGDFWNAPYLSDPGAVWGDWDWPSPIWRGLLVDSDYSGGQYVVGCGPMSVARLIDWAKFTGRVPSSRMIRLPNDSLQNQGSGFNLGAVTNQKDFIQLLFWPVKVGERQVNGSNKRVYAAWLSEKLGSTFFNGQTNTTTAGVLNGANSWLADNGWPERMTGAWSRDVGVLDIVGMALPPVFNFVPWSQATWGVNGTLKDSIGAPTGQDMPAIVSYQTGLSGASVNGIRLGTGHIALAKKFTVVEYWDWSENYAQVNWPNYQGDSSYYSGTSRVYLSDYYDMQFGAYRLRR